MKIDIRRAVTADIDMIAPLFDAYRVFYKQESDLSKARTFIKDRMELHESKIFVAIAGQQDFIGFMQLFPSFSSVSLQRSLILNDLYVKHEFRGKGIGERLLLHAQQYAEMNHYKGLALETGARNPAQKLYEKLGWKQDSDTLNYFWESSTY